MSPGFVIWMARLIDFTGPSTELSLAVLGSTCISRASDRDVNNVMLSITAVIKNLNITLLTRNQRAALEIQ